MFHILFYKQIFANFFKCKTVTVSRETECYNLARESCCTVTRSHEPTLKYKHAQPQPACQCLQDTPGEGSAGTLPSAGYSTQSKGGGRGHSPASERWCQSLPQTHTWNGLCERVAYRPSTQRLRIQNLSPPFSPLLEPRDASYFIST